MLFYRAALPLSSRTLNYTAGIIRRHRVAIGSLRRKLTPGRQAVLVLAQLRKGEAFALLAARVRGKHHHWLGALVAQRHPARTSPRSKRGANYPAAADKRDHPRPDARTGQRKCRVRPKPSGAGTRRCNPHRPEGLPVSGAWKAARRL
jgi:hypothetical protein